MTTAYLSAAPARLTVADVSLLADIADGFSTVEHYDRLDDLRKRLADVVHRTTRIQPTPAERVEQALAAIDAAYRLCAEAHDRVTDLEDQRALLKPKCIAALVGQPDPLKPNGVHSASSAERVVEQHPDYAAHRQLQREIGRARQVRDPEVRPRRG
jgi:hypothetical protein